MFVLSFQVSFRKDREAGVTTVKYNIAKKTDLVINGASCVILNVNLHCNVIIIIIIIIITIIIEGAQLAKAVFSGALMH